MSKADRTRALLLAEAIRQGSVYGFGGVSLGALAVATGLSKSAVFKYFGGSGALQLAAVAALTDAFREQVWRPVRGLPRGRTRLLAILDRWLRWVDAEHGGCGIIQAQIEYDDQPGPVRELLKERQRLWTRLLEREFAVMAPRHDAASAAFEFRSAVLGYNQASRLANDGRAREHAQSMIERLIRRLEVAD